MQSKTSHPDVRNSKPRKYVKKEQKDEETPNDTIKLGLKRSDSHGDLHTGFEKVESRNYFTPSCSQRGSRNNSRKQKGRKPKSKNKPLLPLPEKLKQVDKNPILPTATIKRVSAWCIGMPKFGISEASVELVSSINSNTETKASTAEEKESDNADTGLNAQRQQEKLSSKVSNFIQQPSGDSEFEPQPESQHIEAEELKESEVVKSDPSEKPPLSPAQPRSRRRDSNKGLEIRNRSSDQDSLNLTKTARNHIKIQIEDHKVLNTSSEIPIITINPPEEPRADKTSEMPQQLAASQAKMKSKQKSKNKKPRRSKKKPAETQEEAAEEFLKDDSHSEHLTSSTTPEFDRSKTLSSEEEGRNPAAESEIVQSGKIVYDYQSIMKIVETFPKISQNLPRNIKKFKKRNIKPVSCCKPAAPNPSTFRRSSSSYALPEPETAPSLNFRDNPDSCSSWRVINEEFLKRAKETSAKVQAKPDEVEASRRQIKITLNKLTFDNFERLKSKLFDLSIISDESLIFLVESILNKACTESKFTSLYAKLCSYLLEEYHKFQFSLDRTSQSLKNNKFRRALFESCQVLFEYFDGISNASSSDAKYDKTLVKKKILGNVRFIGELFKEGVILNRIVLECVEDLIDPSIKDRRQPVETSKLKLNEEKLEGACILLLTGGACFDKEGILKDTDRLFRILEEIRTRSDLTPRIRFLIMNVLEARKVGWAEKEEEVEIKVEDESEN
jgi:hypothetical protein